MRPDSLFVAAGVLGNVEADGVIPSLENAAYWMRRSGVRLSLSEYGSLSPESLKALRAAQGRIDAERSKAVTEAVQAAFEGVVEAVSEGAADKAADMLSRLAPEVGQ